MLKNKLSYILILFLISIMAILYNEYYTGVLVVVAVLFPIVIYIILMTTRLGIMASIDTSTQVVNKDEMFDIHIQLYNKSIFPISRLDINLIIYNEYLKEEKKERLQISMNNNCSQQVTTQVSSSYCGRLVFQLKSICLYDFFYIFSTNKKINKSIIVPILPNCIELNNNFIGDNPIFTSESDNFSPYKAGDDPSEVFQIREYREGDKPGRIHWKLSYKQDEFMIKEYSLPLNSNILVLVELYCGQDKKMGIEIVDGLLDCVMSISYSLNEHEHIHNLGWCDNKGVYQKHKITCCEDLLQIIEQLLKVPLRSSLEYSITNNQLLDDKESYSHIIYITHIILIEEILGLAALYKNSICYVFYFGEPMDTQLKSQIESNHIFVYEISSNNIKESLESL